MKVLGARHCSERQTLGSRKKLLTVRRDKGGN